MKKSATFLVAAIAPLVAGMCIAASSNAQSTTSDEAYCQALAKLYMTYVGSVGGSLGGDYSNGPGAADVDGKVAIAQCQEGNPGPAIPVLEQKLRDNRIPSRRGPEARREPSITPFLLLGPGIAVAGQLELEDIKAVASAYSDVQT